MHTTVVGRVTCINLVSKTWLWSYLFIRSGLCVLLWTSFLSLAVFLLHHCCCRHPRQPRCGLSSIGNACYSTLAWTRTLPWRLFCQMGYGVSNLAWIYQWNEGASMKLLYFVNWHSMVFQTLEIWIFKLLLLSRFANFKFAGTLFSFVGPMLCQISIYLEAHSFLLFSFHFGDFVFSFFVT